MQGLNNFIAGAYPILSSTSLLAQSKDSSMAAEILGNLFKNAINDLPQAMMTHLVEAYTQRDKAVHDGRIYQIVNIPNKTDNGQLRWSCTATYVQDNGVLSSRIGRSDGEYCDPEEAMKSALGRASSIVEQQQSLEKNLVVLLISADPQGGTVNIQDMENQIRNEVQKRLGYTGIKRFRFVLRLSVSPNELINLIRDERADVIHFFGHSGRAGLSLRSPDSRNQYHTTTAEGLLAILSLQAAKSVKLLILAGCSNQNIAAKLAKHSKIDYVIGTTANVTNDQAIFFASQFYTGLVNGDTIWESYNSGQAQLAGLNLERSFHLKSKRTESQDALNGNRGCIMWPPS
jgi:hypothetical protein